VITDPKIKDPNIRCLETGSNGITYALTIGGDIFTLKNGRVLKYYSGKDDLGIDSLDFVDIVVIVEKKFGFKIKPEEMANVKTLKQFCDYIESKVG
jgi:acyl carrier protein